MQCSRLLSTHLKDWIKPAINTQIQIISSFNQNNYQVRHKRYFIKDKYASYWINDYKKLPVQTRLNTAEYITKDNEDFIDEIIKEERMNPLNVEPFQREDWKPGSQRCGLIGRKIGIHPMWTETGKKILPTLVQIIDNTVIKYIPPEELVLKDNAYKRRCPKEKLGALIVGAEDADPRLLTKEYKGVFKDTGVFPKRKLTKFLIAPNAKLPPGTPLLATHFNVGSKVDVSAKTIFRGYQGVMKKWGFHGLRSSHGVTKAHRAAGNTGNKKDGHLKGTRLAGNMGDRFITLRGVEIIRINTKYNVLYLKGPIPGAINSYVNLYDTLLYHGRQKEENHQPFPTYFPEDSQLKDDIIAKTYHSFGSPSLSF